MLLSNNPLCLSSLFDRFSYDSQSQFELLLQQPHKKHTCPFVHVCVAKICFQRTFVPLHLGILATWQLDNLASWQPGNLATWKLGNLANWHLVNLLSWQRGNLATWQHGKIGILVTWYLGVWATWQIGNLVATWMRHYPISRKI